MSGNTHMVEDIRDVRSDIEDLAEKDTPDMPDGKEKQLNWIMEQR